MELVRPRNKGRCFFRNFYSYLRSEINWFLVVVIHFSTRIDLLNTPIRKKDHWKRNNRWTTSNIAEFIQPEFREKLCTMPLSIYQFITLSTLFWLAWFIPRLLYSFISDNFFFFFFWSRKKNKFSSIRPFIQKVAHIRSGAIPGYVKNRMKKESICAVGFKRTTTLFDPLNPV